MTRTFPEATYRAGCAPLVSVVIATFNYRRYLNASIDSALAQTYRLIEVIVVDDGSTDGSADLLAGYADRIAALSQSHRGQAAAWNAGFAASRGAIVFFLDADDVLAPDAVETVVVQFQKDRPVKVHWPLSVVNAEGAPTGARIQPEPDFGDLLQRLLRDGPFSYSWPPTSGNAWSRAVLDQILPMPEEPYRISPDLYLAALSPLFGPIGRVVRPLSSWREHGGNSSFRFPFDERLDAAVAREAHCLDALARYCDRLSLPADVAGWQAQSWWHRIRRAVERIVASVPAGRSFMLADDDQWDARPTIRGRTAIPFTERGGLYWGPPADDRAAISEFERLRAAGCTHLCVAWSSSWILEHYRAFAAHLYAVARTVETTRDVTIFDCRR